MRALVATARRTATQVRRDERGMTLVELLIGMTAASVVILAAFFAVDSANKLGFGTQQRIDQISRGREAMERISRDIRAQQCFGSVRPMTAASDTSMTFYTSVANQTNGTTPNAAQPVQQVTLAWTPDNGPDAKKIMASNGNKPVGDITMQVYPGVTNTVTGTTTFPTRTVNTVVANDVEQSPDRRDTTKLSPIFRYYKYASTTGSGRIDYTSPVTMNSSGVVAPTDLAGIVLIEVSFRSSQSGGKVNFNRPDKPMDFYNSISVRIADPTNPGGSPQCL